MHGRAAIAVWGMLALANWRWKARNISSVVYLTLAAKLKEQEAFWVSVSR